MWDLIAKASNFTEDAHEVTLCTFLFNLSVTGSFLPYKALWDGTSASFSGHAGFFQFDFKTAKVFTSFGPLELSRSFCLEVSPRFLTILTLILVLESQSFS